MSAFAGEREKKNTEKSVKYFKTFVPTFYEFLKQSFQKQQDVKIQESRKKTRTTIFSPLNEKKHLYNKTFCAQLNYIPKTLFQSTFIRILTEEAKQIRLSCTVQTMITLITFKTDIFSALWLL